MFDYLPLFDYIKTMELSKLAKIFKALSNEQRLKIYQMVYHRSRCHNEESEYGEKKCCGGGMSKTFTKACECFNISKSTISHHMKELQNAGLISCSKDGQSNICKINPEVVEMIREFFE